MEKRVPKDGFVYRVSTSGEWEELQRTGATLGGSLDRRTGCIHLSDLDQVRMVLNNFFRGREDLYLLQIDATKVGEELIYEAAEGTYFPHFYGPDRSFKPLSLDVVSKAEKLELKNAEFTCSLLDQNCHLCFGGQAPFFPNLWHLNESEIMNYYDLPLLTCNVVMSNNGDGYSDAPWTLMCEVLLSDKKKKRE